MHGLGAIGAIFLAAPCFNAEQGSEQHALVGIRAALHLLGLPQQLKQRLLQQVEDLLLRPVVTSDHGCDSTPPNRR